MNPRGCLIGLLALAFVAIAAPGSAQDEPPPVAEQEIPSAPVAIDGVEYFVMRGAQSFTAEERVSIITEDIIAAAELNLDKPPTVTVRDSDFGMAVVVDGVQVFEFAEADAEFEGYSMEVVAQLYSGRVEQAVAAYREGRSSAGVWEGVWATLLWTALFIVFIVALFKGRTWQRRRVDRRVHRILEKIEEQSGRAIDSSSLIQAHRMLVRGALTIIIALASYYYVAIVLSEFAVTKGFAVLLLETVAAPLIDLGRGALGEIPDFITVVIIILITRYFLKLIRLVFINVENGVIKIKGFDQKWVWPTHRIVRFLIIIAAIVVAYPHIPGSDSEAFKGMTVLLGIVVSLGANSVAANLFAGLIVVYKRSVTDGDRIRIGEIFGTVEGISLLDTHVRTLKNELVSVPNTKLLNTEVTNYTQTSGPMGLIVHTTVGIGYDEPRELVERLLMDAAKATAGVKVKPGPFVLSQSLNAHDVSYEINAFCKKDADPVRVRSELQNRIQDQFRDAGVQIMTPFYTGDPDAPKIPRAPGQTPAGET